MRVQSFLKRCISKSTYGMPYDDILDAPILRILSKTHDATGVPDAIPNTTHVYRMLGN